jgi:GxxExxY protein
LQDWQDAGLAGCRISGLAGCRIGRKQDWQEAGFQDWQDAGLAGLKDDLDGIGQQDWKLRRMQEWRNSQNVKPKNNPEMNTLDEITYKINGCAMKVHNTLGNGFQEVIYQRCLAIELERAGLKFNREKKQEIFYEDIMVGTRRADFLVEDQIIVEIKAIIDLEDVHLAQAKNYVVAYDKAVGLLINFGAKSLQFKKIYNPKYNSNPGNSKQDK